VNLIVVGVHGDLFLGRICLKKILKNLKPYLANRGSEKQLAIWPFLEDVIFRIFSEFEI